MKFLIVLSLCLALAVSKPIDNQNVEVVQDTAGNYKLSLNTIGHTRVEQRNVDGSVSGSYSYVDSNGVVQTVEYTAGPDGFRAVGTNLPVPPAPVVDTADVAAAKISHLTLFEQGLPESV